MSALLEGKADPDRPRNTGFANVFPVFVAAQRGFEDIVKLLLRAKAKPDRVVASSTTALLIAIQQGHDEAVEVLLNGRANPNRAVSGGITPVYVAAQGGHEKALRLLLNAKGDPAQPRHGGISPASVACLCMEPGFTSVVEAVPLWPCTVSLVIDGIDVVTGMWHLKTGTC